MRITRKPPPKEGDERIVKRFAILPIVTDTEIAWLEIVYVLQKYVSSYDGEELSFWWDNVRFVPHDDWKGAQE